MHYTGWLMNFPDQCRGRMREVNHRSVSTGSFPPSADSTLREGRRSRPRQAASVALAKPSDLAAAQFDPPLEEEIRSPWVSALVARPLIGGV
jgi:hypothetical protein